MENILIRRLFIRNPFVFQTQNILNIVVFVIDIISGAMRKDFQKLYSAAGIIFQCTYVQISSITILFLQIYYYLCFSYE